MWSVIDRLLFHFLKYFPHTGFGSQNQVYVNVNIVLDNTKFKVTHNRQKKYSPEDLPHLGRSARTRLKRFPLKQVQIPVNLSHECN